MESWAANFTGHEWRVHLASGSLIEVDVALRRNTYSGRPLGSEAFVERAETLLGRNLRAQKDGRPRKQSPKTLSAAAPASGTLFDIL
jgi:hypothetical protein